ncbi:MAG: GNAT family N-acetyltransferase [Actinomycetota bacterium]|nr:GNAT family N-acetyltransferase [Actinomycetota bacterium]
MPAPPMRIDLGDTVLRAYTVDDAAAVARSVGESLEHLRPWMAWADGDSADEAFQRTRLTGVVGQWERGDEYQYGLFDLDEARILGSFGLMTRRGRGTLEIGYWLHVDARGRGYATQATAALTNVALAVPRVTRALIYVDEANDASAEIPRRLGYTQFRTETVTPTAPGETGRQIVWLRETPIAFDEPEWSGPDTLTEGDR